MIPVNEDFKDTFMQQPYTVCYTHTRGQQMQLKCCQGHHLCNKAFKVSISTHTARFFGGGKLFEFYIYGCFFPIKLNFAHSIKIGSFLS